MKALNEAWFEFAGLRSDQMGAELLSRPKREQGAPNGVNHVVSGRSGRVWVGDGTMDNGTAEVTMMIPSGKMDGVLAWLSGSGLLIFSDEPNRAYRARILQSYTRTQPLPRLSGQQITVRFDLQPFRYQYPEAFDEVYTEPGSIVNPGTAPSQPRLIVEADGDITLTVGGQQMVFEGLAGGVVVDCELMECLSMDETELLNGCAQMDAFPTLPPGVSPIEWTGNVISLTVTPRWRYL